MRRMPDLSDEDREYERYRSLKLAANFCEHAFERDGRWTLLRCYRGVVLANFPAILAPMDLFVLVTDAAGVDPRDLKVDLVDFQDLMSGGIASTVWQDDAPLMAMQFDGVYSASFRVPALAIRHAGRYDLHMEVDGHLLDVASLHLKARR
jgi:hypothetical protein